MSEALAVLTKRIAARLDRLLARLGGLVDPDPARLLAPAPGDNLDAPIGWRADVQPDDWPEGVPWPLSAQQAFGWPEGLPWPLSARQALDAVSGARELLADWIAADIDAAVAALVKPDVHAAALASPDLVAGWRWPLLTAAMGNGAERCGPSYGPRLALGRLVRSWAADLDPVDVGRWPDGALSHRSVAEWAREPLNRLHPAKPSDFKAYLGLDPEAFAALYPGNPALGDILLVDVEAYGEILHIPVLRQASGWPVELHRTTLALLYLVERKTGHTLPGAYGPTFMLDATDPTRRTMTSLAGADPTLLPNSRTGRTGAVTRLDDEPTTLVFSWDDGTSQTLELPFDEPIAALSAVANRYGDKAVADLLVIYALAWAQCGKPSDLWWWPDEHLAMRGLANSKENRKALTDLFERLSRTKLEARYADGGKLSGPILATTLTDGTARKQSLHPALYTGIRAPDGDKRGNRWWPAPIGLLALPADKSAGKVHALAVVLASIFRARLKDKEVSAAKVCSRKLCDNLGITWRTDRPTDSRAGEQLARTLDAGKACGLMASWLVERGGDLSNPDALVCIEPGEAARQIVTGERGTPFPTWIPSTGEELALWLRKQGKSAAEAGRDLGIEERTMRRAAAYGDRPLQPDVRAALRRRLWPDFARKPTDTEGGALTPQRTMGGGGQHR